MRPDPNRAYCCHSCSHIALWKDRLPNGNDAGMKCPKCGHLYAYPVDGRALEIQTLRAEVKELKQGRLDLIIDCERLATDLEQSLRQWNMYAEMREDEDLDTADHWEGEAYRACVKRAKDWRDKAAAISSSEQANP